jgi:3-oxoacyl-[acyl-carrier protein] reductase
MSIEEYDSMFGITRGVYFALQEAAMHLSDNGRIVSISTAGTSQAMAGAGAYAGSKAAIEQFSNCLAKELGARGITVNTWRGTDHDTVGMCSTQEQVAGLVAQLDAGRPKTWPRRIALLRFPDSARRGHMQNVRAARGGYRLDSLARRIVGLSSTQPSDILKPIL